MKINNDKWLLMAIICIIGILITALVFADAVTINPNSSEFKQGFWIGTGSCCLLWGTWTIIRIIIEQVYKT